jgi:hypothetical protein
MKRNFQVYVVDMKSSRFFRNVSICQNIRCHILEERVPNIHCCDKLKVIVFPVLPILLFPLPLRV